MLPEQIKNFREMVTLKDGTYVLLRPMVADDEKCLLEFYSAVSEEDMRYFRHYVKDSSLIHEWCEPGLRQGPAHPCARQRPCGGQRLAPFRRRSTSPCCRGAPLPRQGFRKRGLGMKMIKALIEVARKQGLSILQAEVIAEQTKVVKAFEALGFKSQAVLDDYFLFPDGDSRDVVIMTMHLRQKVDEF
jgi:RimJ/RimL family protein N-acetyltransferase